MQSLRDFLQQLLVSISITPIECIFQTTFRFVDDTDVQNSKISTATLWVVCRNILCPGYAQTMTLDLGSQVISMKRLPSVLCNPLTGEIHEKHLLTITNMKQQDLHLTKTYASAIFGNKNFLQIVKNRLRSKLYTSAGKGKPIDSIRLLVSI